ncbi:MAG: FAD-dependent oxidoreductase [Pseudohongiellaceae bacterium]
MPRIAIIGAGISGLTLAQRLSDHAEIVIHEKSRGPGGRMATRRTGNHHFDTGAQFFTARSRRFRKFLQPAREAGAVVSWEPKLVSIDRSSRNYKRFWFEPHYIGHPMMTSLAKYLAAGHSVLSGSKVTALQDSNGQWSLREENGTVHGPYDWVVGTAPAPQSRTLFGDHGAASEWLDQIRMQPCLCALIRLPVEVPFPWQVVEPRHSMIRWMADQRTKKGRPATRSLVLHAHNDWSDLYFEADEPWLKERFLTELEQLTNIAPEQVTGIELKRWRCARVEQAAEHPFWMDEQLQLGLCGDGGVGGSVESAFTSADRLARALLPVL